MRAIIFIVTIVFCLSCGNYRYYYRTEEQVLANGISDKRFWISIDEVYNFTTHELLPGDNSYIAYENEKATIRFSISANVLTRKQLYRNNLDINAVVKQISAHSFKIEFADDYNFRDFWVEIKVDHNMKDCVGIVYYYNVPQSRFKGLIKINNPK